MNDKSHETAETGAGEAPRKILSPAAKRALAQAQARREQAETEKIAAEREIGGRGGKDPARYGDWEKKGLAIDF